MGDLNILHILCDYSLTFLLLHKRLENGKLNWPRNQNEVQKFTTQQLRWLLEGLSINPKISINPAIKGSIA